MLRFDVKDKPHFASDPETGAVFALSYAPSQDELWGAYIANGVEYRLAIMIEDPARLPQGGFARTPLRIDCAGIYHGLSKLFSSDVKRNSALVRYIAFSLCYIQKERPLIRNAAFRSNFEQFKREMLARDRQVPFEMPTDEELSKASAAG